MPSPLRKLANETALYGLSSIVGRVLNYLLVPFYTSILIPAEYGVVVEWYAYAAFLQILYTYGMETAYFRFAARAPHYFHVATSALLTSSLVFSALLVLAAAPLARLVGYSGSSHYVYYIAAILAVDTALAIPFAQLRLQKRARRFASIKLFQIILNVLLNVAWLYESPYTLPTSWRLYTPIERVEYIFIANLVANTAAIPLFTATWRQLRFRLPWHSLRPMLVYALPLLLMGLAGTTNEMMSRAALRHWMPAHLYPHQHNDAVLGIFGACYKLSIFMSLGVQAFRYAAEPFFFAQAQERHAPTLLSDVMHWFIVVACFLLFAVSVNLDLLGHMLLRKAAYRTALPIVPYLLLAYLLLGVYYNLSVWFKLTDRTLYGVWLTSLGAAVTLVLNMLLIPRIGYWGSVWATLASCATMCSSCYYLGQRHYPVPYHLGKGLGYIIGTMALVLLTRQINYSSFGQAVVINALWTLLFALSLYLLNARSKA